MVCYSDEINQQNLVVNVFYISTTIYLWIGDMLHCYLCIVTAYVRRSN